MLFKHLQLTPCDWGLVSAPVQAGTLLAGSPSGSPPTPDLDSFGRCSTAIIRRSYVLCFVFPAAGFIGWLIEFTMCLEQHVMTLQTPPPPPSPGPTHQSMNGDVLESSVAICAAYLQNTQSPQRISQRFSMKLQLSSLWSASVISGLRRVAVGQVPQQRCEPDSREDFWPPVSLLTSWNVWFAHWCASVLPFLSDLRVKVQDLVPSRGDNRERGQQQLLGNKLDAGHSWSREFVISYIYKHY